MKVFKDRRDAGQQLADKLLKFAKMPDVLVVGLLRGGIVVAQEIAHALQAPLDGLVIRKIGDPGCPELAVGALDPDGRVIISDPILSTTGYTRADLAPFIQKEQEELARRERVYRANRPYAFRDKTVILVDDGIATGLTMQAALHFVRKHAPRALIVAVPVISPEALSLLQPLADDVVYISCTELPGISAAYHVFPQVEDNAVRTILAIAE